MATLVKVAQIETLQGQTTVLHDIDWQQFEAILEDLGDNRASRIAYFDGVLEIRMPLPEHERTKVIISNLLVILLEELDWEWESLGSSTFKTKSMKAGIEPDDCFYIKNYAAMIGKKRLDMSIDPPPDIAIEVDLTSNTQISAYEALAVAEIWRYANGKLSIRLLREGKYVESLVSLSFPDFPVIDGISQFLERGTELSISALRREFRQWVRDRLH
ncbi:MULTISPECIES: Uma2 family endonuclease [Pseudanabaena]|uniref:Uma2 family endonuclease n=1 Tax=Pseudanabaena TaxID=1152 RepID=UPI00247865F5|nr:MULTISPECIES: Uma2 family endonuclease [Pseudanabaena]MEA5490109.1 Uma2 family endonuclease [Pseudanabaena sp. CCNP1317]WGS71654.1 Uma2 family endonuclease [Pseudanabaena galeata CCNP1313]